MSAQSDDVVTQLQSLVDEYEATCNPHAYTSERALYERLCHALGREPLDRPSLHGPLAPRKPPVSGDAE